jgi:hypothetical protein
LAAVQVWPECDFPNAIAQQTCTQRCRQTMDSANFDAMMPPFV